MKRKQPNTASWQSRLRQAWERLWMPRKKNEALHWIPVPVPVQRNSSQ